MTTLRLEGCADSSARAAAAGVHPGRTRLNHHPATPTRNRTASVPAASSGNPDRCNSRSATAARGTATVAALNRSASRMRRPMAARSRLRSAVRSGHSRGGTRDLLLLDCGPIGHGATAQRRAGPVPRARPIVRRSSPTCARHRSSLVPRAARARSARPRRGGRPRAHRRWPDRPAHSTPPGQPRPQRDCRLEHRLGRAVRRRTQRLEQAVRLADSTPESSRGRCLCRRAAR